MTRFKWTNCLYIVAGALLIFVVTASEHTVLAAPRTAIQRIEELLGIPDETDAKAPVDYGPGPGVKSGLKTAGNKSAIAPLASVSSANASQVPVGGVAAFTGGLFGAPVTWPLIAIHAVLLPDGRVMSYGTNASGAQGAQLIYDIWDPTLGTDSNSHLVLPNTTNTDIFCSAQSVMISGDVLTSGGDLTVNGIRNSANNGTTIFSPSANTLTANTPMTYARWYGSLVSLPNGKLAIFGGRQNVGALTPAQPAATPELYDPSLRAWTSLTGATSVPAFGGTDAWYYPRSYIAPGGNVFVLNAGKGTMFYVSTSGVGSITQSKVTAPVGYFAFPTIAFAPGMALSVLMNQQVVVIDYRTSTPVVTPTSNIDQARYWGSGTILADGRVLVTGGSEVYNEMTGVAYQAQIWDPGTGLWTAGASAAKPRLYHSSALLLPDATVLTAGGGAPGPVNNLNAEIYYPPYLYAADGTPAVRPAIIATTANAFNPGDTVGITVGPTDTISRLTFVRTGSATHSNNSDQRFIDLPFTQEGQNVTAVLPTDSTTLLPGFYMLFAFNSAGVPSVSSLINITANAGVVAFTVSPASLALGNVPTSTASASQPMTVTNTGSAPLSITSIALSGANASRFSQTNTCGAPVAVGSTCTINVVFRPISAGYVFATLTVNAPGITQKATVNGTGIVSFTLSSTSLALGNVPTNTASASQPLTVTNTGSAPLPITSIVLSGANAGEFSQTNTCGTSVSVGSTCTINVVFKPTSAGYVFATLTVNAPGVTQKATVNGTGIVSFTVSSTSLALGNVPTSTASASQPLTVTNTGSAPLPITSITLAGANASRFSQTNTCGVPVAVGSTCTINVVFTPVSAGYVWATLNINAPGLTQKATVNGTGVAPP